MVMIPEKRSFSHVKQPLDFRCNYGSSLAREASLVISHHRGRDEASKHIQTSMGFRDEVWFVQFSRDGKYLAAASGTAVCICEVLEYGGFLFLPTLVGHRQPVSYITWSPTNNLQLLTCGVEETVKRWIIAPIGCCLHTYAKRGLGMVSCVWAPDGQSIFTGLNNGSIIMWNLQGDELRSWEGTKTTRIADLVITRDGRELITTCEEDTILLFNWESGSERYIDEDGAIVSLSLSEDSTLLLVSMSYALIHLWDIGLETPQMVTFFDGHKRQRFVVRACFCGANPLVVASGSEDSKVYISEYETEEHRTLAGHSAVVNCVSSNPTDPRMLASGSDDRTIRLWRY